MPSDPTPNPNPPPSGKPRRRPAPGLGGNLIWVVVLALLVGWFLFNGGTGSGGSIDWGEFWSLLEHEKLKKVVVIGSERISGEITDLDGVPEPIKESLSKKLRNNTKKFTVERIHIDDYGDLAKRLQKQAASLEHPLQLSQEADHFSWFLQPLMVVVLPALILLAVFLFLLPRFRDPLGGGFLSNYIKSPARRYERSKMRVTFDDVAGMQNAKRELQEVVEFLQQPREVPAPRRRRAQGRAAGRSAGHRQDAPGPRRRRRGRRAVLQHQRLRVHSDVRRRRRQPRPRHVQDRQGQRPLHPLHRRDRRRRPHARRRRRRRLGRARADPQPDPQRDGRLHADRDRSSSWPPPTGRTCSIRRCCVRAVSIATSPSIGRPGRGGWPSSRSTRATSRWPTTSTWKRSPAA